ncbi:MAG: GNAT family N-acetyltransferase [Candidatus Zixiibacteriota bacterium]
MVEIIQATTKEHLAAVYELFREYIESLGFDLSFQNIEEEIANLPGEYAPPEGRLYLALCDGQPAGCVGLRQLSSVICEMKRMWVRPQFRGKKIGHTLAEKVVEDARAIGYRKMVLDTIDTMAEAMAIYRSLGFKSVQPYYYNPIDGATFFEKDLTEDTVKS